MICNVLSGEKDVIGAGYLFAILQVIRTIYSS
jgi:hypothetical protein